MKALRSILAATLTATLAAAALAAEPERAQTPAVQVGAEAKPTEAAPQPVVEAPLTREQILEQGAKAVAATCAGICHDSNKWEEARWPRDTWINTLDYMAAQMEGQGRRFEDRTYRLILEYMLLAYPQ